MKGIKYGSRNFDDYWFFANNIDKDGYDLLLSINDTLEASTNKDFNIVRKYLTGFIRDIYYNSHDGANPPSPYLPE